MELTLELREESGLQWVLERLAPMSPFGRAAARSLRWYAPGQEAALETELDNVSLALALWNGEDPTQTVDLEEDHYVWLPYRMVTRENLEQFRQQAPQSRGLAG